MAVTPQRKGLLGESVERPEMAWNACFTSWWHLSPGCASWASSPQVEDTDWGVLEDPLWKVQRGVFPFPFPGLRMP